MPVETPRFTRALEQHLRERATRRRRRVPSLRPVLAVAAVLAALAYVLLPGERDEPDRAADDPIAGAYTITPEELVTANRAELRRYQREFARRGERLIVTEKRVAPGSSHAGAVSSLSIPGPRARRGARDPIVVEELDGPVRITIGVVAPGERLAGLSVCQTIPRLKPLVDGDDPEGSIRRMREAGFDVEVKTVPWDRPGDRDVLIGIYDSEGRNTGVAPEAKRLTVEVGSPGEGHTGVAC